jgi:hypothetical protein
MFFYCGISSAQDSVCRKSVFYVGLWPKVSSNGKDAGLYTNYFSLNLFLTHSANERILGISGLAAAIEDNASGIQISGLSLGVGHVMSGLSFAPVNIAGTHKGFQISPIYNSSDTLDGIQLGGFNHVKKLSGILPSFKAGDFNIFAGASFNYVQSSHIENQSLFPGTYVWRNWTTTFLQQLNFGFMTGVQYCF